MSETKKVVVQEGSSSANNRKVKYSELEDGATRVIFGQSIDKELVECIAKEVLMEEKCI